MITDRTFEDVEYAKKLIKEIQEGKEITLEYLNGLKGCYNASDLNRVENKVMQLSERLNEYNYIHNVSCKTNWDYLSEFNIKDMERYLLNIETLRSVYYVLKNTPQTPKSYKPYTNANNIEKILVDIDYLITRMILSFRKCGTFNSGGMEGLI